MKKHTSLGYYFLNKRLHPQAPKGYRIDICLFIVNKNKTKNHNKILFVQQNSGFWNLPKEGLKLATVADDIFTTLARNLDEELGFHGIKVTETKPLFKQVALLFDFDKQKYDPTRSKEEKLRGRSEKGKIYHLAIMHYFGPDEVPLPTKKDEIVNFRWVDEHEGKFLMQSNKDLYQEKKITSLGSALFNIELFDKAYIAYQTIEKTNSKQTSLFNND